MNQRFLTVLIFAFLVAGGASLLLYRLMASRVPVKAGPPTTQVIVAARNLGLGTLIKDSDLKFGEWTGTVPPSAVLKKDDIIGRGVVATIYEGEPVLESRLAAKGAGAGLAAMIPAGMRAVAIRVNEVVGVSGFVVSGMRVDVLISGNPPGTSAAELGHLSKTLLQNIEVLSAGQNFQKDAEGKPVQVPVVNLLVTPDQAEMLSLASNQTTIQLVLRNPLDNQVAQTPGTAVARLFGNMLPAPKPEVKPRPVAAPKPAPKPEEKPAPPPPFVVEMFHGGRKADAQFQAGQEVRK